MRANRRSRTTVAAIAAGTLGVVGAIVPVLPASAATVIDLTTGTTAEPVSNGFVQFSEFDSSTGTGVFESFVRIQASPTERGFNSDTPNFDDLSSSNFTRDLAFNAVPVIIDPPGLAPGAYREFRLDINQTSSNSFLTLETAKLWISSERDVQPDRFDDATKSFDPALADQSLIWDMDLGSDRQIKLDYNRAPGSGNGDMILLIPDGSFDCAEENNCWVTLYSEFGGVYGANGQATATPTSWPSNDGFEEWSVRKQIIAPTASKTADPAFDRDISWTLDKTVDVDSWSLFAGDSATSEYTLEVDKTVTDSNFRATGIVRLDNVPEPEGGSPNQAQIKVNDVEDLTTAGTDAHPAPSAGSWNGVIGDCAIDGVDAVTLPATVAGGEFLVCEYAVDFGDTDPRGTYGDWFTNTVTFFVDGQGNDPDTEVSALEEFRLTDDNAVVNGPASVTIDDVSDQEGPQSFGPFSDDESTGYTAVFECSTNASDYTGGHYQYEVDNTATVDETTPDLVDSETVTVDCYLPTVTKDADTSFTRSYTWDVDKKVKQTGPFDAGYTPQYPNYVDDIPSGGGDPLLLSDGQVLTLTYGVNVTYSSSDSDWAADGNITVTNPNPDRGLVVNSLSDLITKSGAADIAATVDCGEVTWPLTIAAQSPLNCTYAADLPDATGRTNTATAVVQNYDFDASGSTPSGTSSFNGQAAVSFASATMTEVDPCVDVYDDKATGTDELLGTVCAPGADRPVGAEIAGAGDEFTYTLDIGKVDDSTTVDILLECGENSFTNVATVYRLGESAANEDTALASDEVTVSATVACADGCTLTQGYWKTHSEKGPAPYDDTWALLPNGADTAFYGSGKTWYQVFWTSPGQAKKNGFKSQEYVILAHQFMAAELNVLNGADTTTAVDAALASAETYFAAGGTGLTRSQVIALAGTLGSYNEGAIGPGHCDQ